MTFLANCSEDPLHFLCFVLSILASQVAWIIQARYFVLGLAQSWNPPLISCYTEANAHWIGSFPTDGAKTGFSSVRKAITLWTREWLHVDLPFYFHPAAEMIQNILWITHLRMKWYNEKVGALNSKRTDDKLLLLKGIPEWSPNQFLTDVTYVPHRLSQGFCEIRTSR